MLFAQDYRYICGCLKKDSVSYLLKDNKYAFLQDSLALLITWILSITNGYWMYIMTARNTQQEVRAKIQRKTLDTESHEDRTWDRIITCPYDAPGIKTLINVTLFYKNTFIWCLHIDCVSSSETGEAGYIWDQVGHSEIKEWQGMQ